MLHSVLLAWLGVWGTSTFGADCQELPWAGWLDQHAGWLARPACCGNHLAVVSLQRLVDLHMLSLQHLAMVSLQRLVDFQMRVCACWKAA
jgi:hypothetical protein